MEKDSKFQRNYDNDKSSYQKYRDKSSNYSSSKNYNGNYHNYNNQHNNKKRRPVWHGDNDSDDDILKLDPLERCVSGNRQTNWNNKRPKFNNGNTNNNNNNNNNNSNNDNINGNNNNRSNTSLQFRINELQDRCIEKDITIKNKDLALLNKEEIIAELKFKHERELLEIERNYDHKILNIHQEQNDLVDQHDKEIEKLKGYLDNKREIITKLREQLDEANRDILVTRKILETTNLRNIELTKKISELTEEKKVSKCNKRIQTDPLPIPIEISSSSKTDLDIKSLNHTKISSMSPPAAAITLSSTSTETFAIKTQPQFSKSQPQRTLQPFIDRLNRNDSLDSLGSYARSESFNSQMSSEISTGGENIMKSLFDHHFSAASTCRTNDLRKLIYINSPQNPRNQNLTINIDGTKSEDYVMVEYIESPDEMPIKSEIMSSGFEDVHKTDEKMEGHTEKSIDSTKSVDNCVENSKEQNSEISTDDSKKLEDDRKNLAADIKVISRLLNFSYDDISTEEYETADESLRKQDVGLKTSDSSPTYSDKESICSDKNVANSDKNPLNSDKNPPNFDKNPANSDKNPTSSDIYSTRLKKDSTEHSEDSSDSLRNTARLRAEKSPKSQSNRTYQNSVYSSDKCERSIMTTNRNLDVISSLRNLDKDFRNSADILRMSAERLLFGTSDVNSDDSSASFEEKSETLRSLRNSGKTVENSDRISRKSDEIPDSAERLDRCFRDTRNSVKGFKNSAEKPKNSVENHRSSTEDRRNSAENPRSSAKRPRCSAENPEYAHKKIDYKTTRKSTRHNKIFGTISENSESLKISDRHHSNMDKFTDDMQESRDFCSLSSRDSEDSSNNLLEKLNIFTGKRLAISNEIFKSPQNGRFSPEKHNDEEIIARLRESLQSTPNPNFSDSEELNRISSEIEDSRRFMSKLHRRSMNSSKDSLNSLDENVSISSELQDILQLSTEIDSAEDPTPPAPTISNEKFKEFAKKVKEKLEINKRQKASRESLHIPIIPCYSNDRKISSENADEKVMNNDDSTVSQSDDLMTENNAHPKTNQNNLENDLHMFSGNSECRLPPTDRIKQEKDVDVNEESFESQVKIKCESNITNESTDSHDDQLLIDNKIISDKLSDDKCVEDKNVGIESCRNFEWQNREGVDVDKVDGINKNDKGTSKSVGKDDVCDELTGSGSGKLESEVRNDEGEALDLSDSKGDLDIDPTLDDRENTKSDIPQNEVNDSGAIAINDNDENMSEISKMTEEFLAVSRQGSNETEKNDKKCDNQDESPQISEIYDSIPQQPIQEMEVINDEKKLEDLEETIKILEGQPEVEEKIVEEPEDMVERMLEKLMGSSGSDEKSQKNDSECFKNPNPDGPDEQIQESISQENSQNQENPKVENEIFDKTQEHQENDKADDQNDGHSLTEINDKTIAQNNECSSPAFDNSIHSKLNSEIATKNQHDSIKNDAISANNPDNLQKSNSPTTQEGLSSSDIVEKCEDKEEIDDDSVRITKGLQKCKEYLESAEIDESEPKNIEENLEIQENSETQDILEIPLEISSNADDLSNCSVHSASISVKSENCSPNLTEISNESFDDQRNSLVDHEKFPTISQEAPEIREKSTNVEENTQKSNEHQQIYPSDASQKSVETVSNINESNEPKIVPNYQSSSSLLKGFLHLIQIDRNSNQNSQNLSQKFANINQNSSNSVQSSPNLEKVSENLSIFQNLTQKSPNSSNLNQNLTDSSKSSPNLDNLNRNLPKSDQNSPHLIQNLLNMNQKSPTIDQNSSSTIQIGQISANHQPETTNSSQTFSKSQQILLNLRENLKNLQQSPPKLISTNSPNIQPIQRPTLVSDDMYQNSINWHLDSSSLTHNLQKLSSFTSKNQKVDNFGENSASLIQNSINLGQNLAKVTQHSSIVEERPINLSINFITSESSSQGSSNSTNMGLSFKFTSNSGQITKNSPEIMQSSANVSSIPSTLCQDYSQFGQSAPILSKVSPTSVPASSNVGQVSSHPVQFSPNVGQTSPGLGKVSPNLGQIASNSAQVSSIVSQASANLSHVPPNMNRTSPHLNQKSSYSNQESPIVSQTSSNLNQKTQIVSQRSSNLNQESPNFGGVSPSIKLGHVSPNLSQTSPNLNQKPPNFGPVSPQMSQTSPNLRKVAPTYHQVLPNPPNLSQNSITATTPTQTPVILTILNQSPGNSINMTHQNQNFTLKPSNKVHIIANQTILSQAPSNLMKSASNIQNISNFQTNQTQKNTNTETKNRPSKPATTHHKNHHGHYEIHQTYLQRYQEFLSTCLGKTYTSQESVNATPVQVIYPTYSVEQTVSIPQTASVPQMASTQQMVSVPQTASTQQMVSISQPLITQAVSTQQIVSGQQLISTLQTISAQHSASTPQTTSTLQPVNSRPPSRTLQTIFIEERQKMIEEDGLKLQKMREEFNQRRASGKIMKRRESTFLTPEMYLRKKQKVEKAKERAKRDEEMSAIFHKLKSNDIVKSDDKVNNEDRTLKKAPDMPDLRSTMSTSSLKNQKVLSRNRDHVSQNIATSADKQWTTVQNQAGTSAAQPNVVQVQIMGEGFHYTIPIGTNVEQAHSNNDLAYSNESDVQSTSQQSSTGHVAATCGIQIRPIFELTNSTDSNAIKATETRSTYCQPGSIQSAFAQLVNEIIPHKGLDEAQMSDSDTERSQCLTQYTCQSNLSESINVQPMTLSQTNAEETIISETQPQPNNQEPSLGEVTVIQQPSTSHLISDIIQISTTGSQPLPIIKVKDDDQLMKDKSVQKVTESSTAQSISHSMSIETKSQEEKSSSAEILSESINNQSQSNSSENMTDRRNSQKELSVQIPQSDSNQSIPTDSSKSEKVQIWQSENPIWTNTIQSSSQISPTVSLTSSIKGLPTHIWTVNSVTKDDQFKQQVEQTNIDSRQAQKRRIDEPVSPLDMLKSQIKSSNVQARSPSYQTRSQNKQLSYEDLKRHREHLHRQSPKKMSSPSKMSSPNKEGLLEMGVCSQIVASSLRKSQQAREKSSSSEERSLKSFQGYSSSDQHRGLRHDDSGSSNNSHGGRQKIDRNRRSSMLCESPYKTSRSGRGSSSMRDRKSMPRSISLNTSSGYQNMPKSPAYHRSISNQEHLYRGNSRDSPKYNRNLRKTFPSPSPSPPPLTIDEHNPKRLQNKNDISQMVITELTVFYELKKFESENPKELFKAMARTITYHFYDKNPDTLPSKSTVKNYIMEVFYNYGTIKSEKDFLLTDECNDF